MGRTKEEWGEVHEKFVAGTLMVVGLLWTGIAFLRGWRP